MNSVTSKSTILYINQNRQEDFEVLFGKGISEAFSWRDSFKRIIFICYSSTKEYLYKKLFGNCYLIGIPFDLSPSPIKSMFNIGKNYCKLYLFLSRIIKITTIDIIRMENLLLSGPPTYIISKLNNIPYVMWLGGHERNALFAKYKKNLFTYLLAKLVVFLEKIILKNANFVFPVSDELLELTEKRNVKNKILSPNYVNLSIFKDLNLKTNSISNKKLSILYVGRFEEEKGIKVLLNAIKILSKESNEFEVSMAGDGSLKEWILDFTRKNKLNIKLLGKIDHKEMPKIYNSADIFILPSHTEGSPASLIEAMSCGIASIATAVGESKKIIDNGKNGILIPPGDPHKVSSAIKHLLNNRDLLEKFSKNGRNSILKYTKDYTKIHKFVFEKILKMHNQ